MSCRAAPSSAARRAGCCRRRFLSGSSARRWCSTFSRGSRWQPAPRSWPTAPGALGWPLAALHLVTLGVLGMAALGAGAQLLPVATRQPAPGHRLLGALWWPYTGGVAVLALGMGFAQPLWLAVGAVAVDARVPGVGRAHVSQPARRARHARRRRAWLVALFALLVVLVSALSLAATWLGLPAPSRDAVLAVHAVWAPYGFMGMLVLGLSYILVPMFALADTARRAGTTFFLGPGVGSALAGGIGRRVHAGGLRLAHRRLAVRQRGGGAAPAADAAGRCEAACAANWGARSRW